MIYSLFSITMTCSLDVLLLYAKPVICIHTAILWSRKTTMWNVCKGFIWGIFSDWELSFILPNFTIVYVINCIMDFFFSLLLFVLTDKWYGNHWESGENIWLRQKAWWLFTCAGRWAILPALQGIGVIFRLFCFTHANVNLINIYLC
jgi:hypothetical protein